MSDVDFVPRHETEHPRRAFLTGAAAAGAAALLVGSGRAAFAAPEKQPDHTHSWAYGGVMQAATTCVGEGHVCLNHCLNSFQAGDNSLIACGVAVQETIAACNALAQLAASNSRHTKAFAEACGAVCSDCEKECRKHAAKHDACGKCADACQGLVGEVKKAA
ncbi:MAG: four-helix bundle copper-binding protein [Gammaproteobacteria bacterium]|nr:four-helix bundle copper-binding protein [Gammaproteobacteria bacterium]